LTQGQRVSYTSEMSVVVGRIFVALHEPAGRGTPSEGTVKHIVPVAKEGLPFVVPALLAGLVSFGIGWPVIGGFLLACGLALGLFFRDPKRETPCSPQLAFCPADGKVVSTTHIHEGDYLQSRCQRISVFMSLFNVHINYAPVAGSVEYMKYEKGDFRRANHPQASLSNENNSIGIRREGHRVMVRQIAGTIARRIVCRVKLNDTVQAGQKIGLIKFGSRVDVFIPADWEVLVAQGDRVKGGISPIARMP